MAFKVPSSALISAPSVETYPEAVVHLRDLEERARTLIGLIRRNGVDLARVRFEQGRVADLALRMTNARMEDLAEQVGVGEKTLYDAHLVYRRFGTRPEMERQIRAWEEEGREITWSMVRNHARNRLPEDTGKARSVLQDKALRLERKASNLEAEAADVEAQAERLRTATTPEVDPVLADELDGIAAKAREVAEDTRRQAEELRHTAIPKPSRPTDDRYLAYVRSHPCLQCGREEDVQAHHLDRGGMGTKGSDRFTVPLCGECHGHLHQYGDAKFWGPINPWKYVAQLMDKAWNNR